MLVGMGHAKIQTHPVQKVGFWQRDTARLKVGRHVKHQPVRACPQTGMVVQHAVGVAAIGVQNKGFDQRCLLTLRGVQRHLHAGGGRAVHGVQYVCAQAHGGVLFGGFRVNFQSVYTFLIYRYDDRMDSTTTGFIVETLTRSIVEHRLQPGTKLVEQTLADQFGVSRTLIRQALFKLSQNRLIHMAPARGAFVAAPSIAEAQQVFSVRRMLEAGMTQAFVRQATQEHIDALNDHIADEEAAVMRGDVPGRTTLLGDFHVRMAQLMGNEVLAHLLMDLLSRCALITLMYQSAGAAEHSHEEHRAIVHALQARDEALALRLMDEHLLHVEASLQLAPQATQATSP